ncbi:sensor histidine kinase [Acidovorax sp. LjRoot194]|uniref:sensor histidine kinase n=1 Tax=Acidovorax sp. LjRoot194 TaxID=3342280 RepID=UPI003ECF2828
MKRLLRRPALEMPRLEMPRLGLPAFRLRILVRSVFLLLAAATVALSVVLLKEEKERAWQSYQNGFKRSQSEVMARLRHPSGQLALLNAHIQGQGATPLAPLLLPYAAIDFDDQNKAQQAVEMAGCAVQYPDGATACAAIGNNPYAGGFIYLVGSFYAGELVARERGALDLAAVHRARVTLDMRGTTSRWVAPFEALPPQGSIQTRGRLTGFADVGEEALDVRARPVRDFRGWLWQSNACRDPAGTAPGCLRRTFYSIRLPVELFREALFGKQPLVWPPEDLGSMRVRVEMLGPGNSSVLFDSNTPGAQPAASLADVARSLLPGEKVQIRKLGSSEQDALTLRGTEVEAGPTAPWLIRLISWLPLDLQGPGEAKVQEVPAGLDILDTPLGNYAVTFTGNLRGVEQGLAVVATRMSWYLGAMLAAIALAWLAVEVGLLRRVTALTRRAAAVSYNVQDGHIGPRLGDLDVSDLRGSDELGILAGGLADLLQRVKDDIQREQLRAQQERDMWHAVGHEIMSPLQSLMVLHGGPGDPGHRYVQRMQQAVHVLYGTASPAEALQAADLPQGRLDLDAFLRHVADNAHFAGIGNVVYQGGTGPVVVRADEFALEDVVTHILGNADRYRPAGTAITLTLKASESTASATLHNQGSTIEEDLLGRIFELGVSDPSLPTPPGGSEHRGQGLFVAKTYMAKMGGTVNARNTDDGVAFTLTFQRLG